MVTVRMNMLLRFVRVVGKTFLFLFIKDAGCFVFKSIHCNVYQSGMVVILEKNLYNFWIALSSMSTVSTILNEIQYLKITKTNKYPEILPNLT